MKNTEGLSANWSTREQDIMFHFPRKPDGHYLAMVLSQTVTDELQRRGYDITTLKFSIRLKTPSPGQEAK